MGRRAEELEAERTYELIRKEKLENGTWFKSFMKFLFSQLGLVILGVATAVLGANMFIAIESPYEQTLYEEKKKVAQEIINAENYLAARFWNYIQDVDTYNFSYTQFQDKVDSDLRLLISFVVDACENNNYDGTIDGWDTWWTFPLSLLFCITIMTTVGYGYTYPRTITGQMVTIIYTMIAVGVNFAMLTNVGSAFADSLTFAYSRCCCRWFRSRRVEIEIPSRISRKRLRRRLVDEDVGDELFMPTNTIPIPIIVNIVIMFTYIALGAFFFSKWEVWDIASSAYFAFITLLTIGFGDYVPVQSFTGVSKPDATGMDYFRLLFAIFYSAIGVALISMCVSLIQEQAARSAALAMGLKKEVIEMDVVVVQKRRPSFGKTGFVSTEVDDVPEVVTEQPGVDVPLVTDGASPLPGMPDDVKDEEEQETEDKDEGDDNGEEGNAGDEEGDDGDDDDEDEDGDDEDEDDDDDDDDNDDEEGDDNKEDEDDDSE